MVLGFGLRRHSTSYLFPSSNFVNYGLRVPGFGWLRVNMGLGFKA